jgi:hypothetical protein
MCDKQKNIRGDQDVKKNSRVIGKSQFIFAQQNAFNPVLISRVQKMRNKS